MMKFPLFRDKKCLQTCWTNEFWLVQGVRKQWKVFVSCVPYDVVPSHLPWFDGGLLILWHRKSAFGSAPSLNLCMNSISDLGFNMLPLLWQFIQIPVTVNFAFQVVFNLWTFDNWLNDFQMHSTIQDLWVTKTLNCLQVLYTYI